MSGPYATESLNRALEDSLYIGRAHSVGARGIDADLLGFGVGLNALCWLRKLRRDALADAA